MPQNKIQDLQKKDISEHSPKFRKTNPYKRLNMFLALLFITIPYYIGKIYWQDLESFIPDRYNRIIFIVSLFQIPAANIPFIFFTILYIFKFKFFEKFKTNNIPWPWETKDKNWKKKIAKMIFIYILNLLFFGEIIGRIFYYFSKTATESKNYPSL